MTTFSFFIPFIPFPLLPRILGVSVLSPDDGVVFGPSCLLLVYCGNFVSVFNFWIVRYR